jgi:formylglycine-generating enzyme required for sulfatase activity
VLVPPADQPVALGLGELSAGGGEALTGFRPAANIKAPSGAFEIQQHEVSWSELEPWLAQHPEHRFQPPPGTPASPEDRARLPVTGVPWATARAYCRSLGGDLPGEEQWEYAARGPSRRPYPWGASPLDLQRTHAYQGPGARPRPVMTSEQDRTAGPAARAIHDLMGNAREWTLDLYRADGDGAVEAWVQADGRAFRAIRGLPLSRPAPSRLPREGAAVRDALCASGACPADVDEARRSVGFRCVRAVTGGP